ncbi:transcriptional regulator, Crp/Fnr family (plasmid) [Acidisarcina polymorpha]|uniref:Transcriptional regulator, Crp/Fnr family n=1 Tax=Acidisarcina polymorpha TaxID=2211140 RepID=A0A2Z5GAR7_9BACT|nr:Crp/Fnr family transcriptional regulator [Acidisarcina polymorpha]AXC16089.1 transcriptional regulator, Crp/Fnr family [Acidisarcina polymorpha]
MKNPAQTAFDPATYLATAGLGREIVRLMEGEVFFSQGSRCDSVFYLQKGRARLTIVSAAGKEATITVFTAGDFIGEACLAAASGPHLATATAVTGCIALKMERKEIIRVLHEQRAFSDLFIASLLVRSMRTQADLVDQLFNSSEKRLARVLLLMAQFGKPGEVADEKTLIPPITQQALAEMIGTTRARVSLFMNRFRKQGYVEYKERIYVHKALLNVILHDQISGANFQNASLLDEGRDESEAARHRAKPLRTIPCS